MAHLLRPNQHTTLAYDLGWGVLHRGVSRVYDPNAFSGDLATLQSAIRAFNDAGAISGEAGIRERLEKLILAGEIWFAAGHLAIAWFRAPSGVCVELVLHVYAALEAVEVAWNRLRGKPADDNWRVMPREELCALLVSIGLKGADLVHAVITFHAGNDYNRA